jgi:hypothetical protein
MQVLRTPKQRKRTAAAAALPPLESESELMSKQTTFLPLSLPRSVHLQLRLTALTSYLLPPPPEPMPNYIS